MLNFLSEIWFRKNSRSLIINLVVGVIGATVAIYVAFSVFSSLFNLDFLSGPYRNPDSTAIFNFLYIEGSDPRWLAFLKAAGNTLSIVAFALVIASLLGLIVGVVRLSGNPLLVWVSKLYVETFRNLPLLVIMFFAAFAVFQSLPPVEDDFGWSGVFYISSFGVAVPWLTVGNSLWWVWLLVLAVAVVAFTLVRRTLTKREDVTGNPTRPLTWGLVTFFGIAIVGYLVLLFPIRVTLPTPSLGAYEGGNLLRFEYFAGMISLSLYFSAFIAEIVRGSIQAISHGQTEASEALGLNGYQRLSLIVLPQALRIMIPSLNNEYQNTNKDSSLAHAIGYGEMVLVVNKVVNNAGNLLQGYLFIFIVFVLTNLIISFIMNRINKRVQLN